MAGYANTGTALPTLQIRTAGVQFTERRPIQFNFAYKLLLLFLVVLYSNIARQFPALEPIRPAQLVASLALFTLIVEHTLAWRHFEMVWPESYALLAFAGVSGLSVLTALWVPWALTWEMDLLKMAAIYFLIVNVVDDERRLRLVAWTMVLGGLFPALGALNFYRQGIMVEGRARWHGIFANPNELAYGLVLLIPLAAALGAGRSRIVRAVLWGCIAAFMLTIYLTQSRGALLGLLVVLTLMGWRQKIPSIRIAMGAGILASILFAGIWWNRSQGFTNLSSDTHVQQRVATIKAGFEMFLDHPFLGVGVGCSSIGWPLYAPPGSFSPNWLHIHNTFVQVLCETGLLGFIPFILFLAFTLVHARRMAAMPSSPELASVPPLANAAEIAIWGFMVCGMSGGFALSWFPYILAGLVSAMKKITDTNAASAPAVRRGAQLLKAS